MQIQAKVEKLFKEWVILIEFKDAIIQAISVKEYYLVQKDEKVKRRTIKEKANDLIEQSWNQYVDLNNEERLRNMSSREHAKRTELQSRPSTR